MNESWVRATLAPHVSDSLLILKTWPDGSKLTILISDFVTLFSTVTTPNYTNLKSADGQKGYAAYFDQWKAEGLLN